MRPGLAVGVAAVALLACGAVRTAAGGDWSARFALDNDQFNFWQLPQHRPDFGYTHGTELAIRRERAPSRLARLAPEWLIGVDGGETALELRVRQSIFSPWAFPEDRPFAGWLELAVGVSRHSAGLRRELLLHAGVTGPPSGAARLQRSIHARFEQGPPPDWSGQLPFEPGLGLESGTTWRWTSNGAASGPRFELGGSLRVRLATYAVDLRVGLPMIMGWSHAGLWAGAESRPAGPSLYVRAHPRLDWIGRDEFLGRPLFRSGTGPEPRPLVAESEVALGAGAGRLAIEWAVMRRTREFDAQPAYHTYSSLALSWLP